MSLELDLDDWDRLSARTIFGDRDVASGFPFPQPLLGPVPLGDGYAVVDEWVESEQELRLERLLRAL